MQFRTLPTANTGIPVTAVNKRSLKYIEVPTQTLHTLDDAIC